MVDISERNLEQTIEATLLAGGPTPTLKEKASLSSLWKLTRMLPAAIALESRRIMTKHFASIRAWFSISSMRHKRRYGSV
jgi:hypothetical protein